MKELWLAFQVEYLKNRHSKFVILTFAAISLAPIFAAIFMIMYKNQESESLQGLLETKSMLFSFEANWDSFLAIMTQAIGVGGIVVFGFVVSWLFGREYTEGTAKDLLALPVSRTGIMNAKFLYYSIWCLLIAVYNLAFGMILGFFIGLPDFTWQGFLQHLNHYFITTLMVIILNAVVALFALIGKGYLLPLGFVIMMLVFAQILGALGFGIYFPWSVPGIFSGSAGTDLKDQLDFLSFAILNLTGFLGYFGTIYRWKYADHI